MGGESQNAKDDLAKQVLGLGYNELDDIKKSVVDLMYDGAPPGLHPQLKTDDRNYWDRLADRVADYLPDFGQQGKYSVEIRHRLTHTSGLPGKARDSASSQSSSQIAYPSPSASA